MLRSTLVSSGDTYMVIWETETWTSSELFDRLSSESNTIHKIPIKICKTNSEHLLEVNRMIDVIEDSGIETFDNTQTICRNL